jgi:hypothetical protein
MVTGCLQLCIQLLQSKKTRHGPDVVANSGRNFLCSISAASHDLTTVTFTDGDEFDTRDRISGLQVPHKEGADPPGVNQRHCACYMCRGGGGGGGGRGGRAARGRQPSVRIWLEVMILATCSTPALCSMGERSASAEPGEKGNVGCAPTSMSCGCARRAISV